MKLRGLCLLCLIGLGLFATRLVAARELLTPEERRWLQQHGSLRYAPDPVFPPFEFFRADGQLSGITPEILEIMARNLGTTIQPVRFPTWSAVLQGIKQGQVDLLGTLTRTAERESFLDFTSTYLSVPNVVYVNATSPWRLGFAELAGSRVGVVRDSGAHNWLKEHHPEVTIVPVTNTRDGLRELSLGRLDAMLEALPVASYVISENSYTNLRALPEVVYAVPQHLAVRKGDTQLLAILEKGLASVPPEERLRIFSRWTGEDPGKAPRFLPQWVVRSGAVLLLIVAGFAAWNYSLRKLVASRTKDLQEREGQFRQLLEDLPIAVAWADAHGRIEFCNRVFTGKFGYGLTDVPTLDDWFRRGYPDEAYRTKIREAWAAGLQMVQRTGVVAQPLEAQITCQDGSRRTVSIATRIVAGKTLAIFDDLTDRVRMEQQLRQAQKMEAVGQLAGGIAHDFNNLLTVIQGNTDLLLHDTSVVGEVRDSVQQIMEVARRAANLTRQLLTFSRRQALQPQLLNLNEVLGTAYQLLNRLLGEHVTLEVRYAPDRPLVLADPGMMEQIIVNLAVNARDAMPRGGKLQIGTSVLTVGPADLPHRPPEARPGRYTCLLFTDTGTGIKPADLPHLFEPFFTTKDVGKGTGLGLATVYGIVQQHQGWIEVASKVGEGTTLSVYLPVAADTPPPAPIEPQAAGPLVGTETILLVEDESLVRSLAKQCLLRSGYQVLEATDGVEALKIWQQHRDRIDLLLTDMVMPSGLSGLDLATQLLKEKPGLRVIYTSGYSRNLLGNNPEWSSQANFIAKPFGVTQLQTAVRQCLDGKTLTGG